MSETSGRSRRKFHSRKKKNRWLPALVLIVVAMAGAIFVVQKNTGKQLVSFLPRTIREMTGAGGNEADGVPGLEETGKVGRGTNKAQKNGTEVSNNELTGGKDAEVGENASGAGDGGTSGNGKAGGTSGGMAGETAGETAGTAAEGAHPASADDAAIAEGASAGEAEESTEPSTEKSVEESAEESTEESTEALPQYRYAADETTQWIEPAAKNRIVVRFAGDILFDDRYAIMASLLERTGRAPRVEAAFDAGLLSLMRSADIFMVNNEFPYSKKGAPLEGKTYTFRADPAYAQLLEDMGTDIAGLANNHVNDYGRQAMTDTFETLEALGMPYVGAGRNIADASRPFYFTNGQVKIGFVAATQIERMGNPDTVGAGEDSPGVFRCYNPERLLEQIRSMKEQCDAVVVFVHWGTESTHQTDSWQEKQAVQFAEAGADLIVGAPPHVLQKVGFAGASPAPGFYSLGNYLFSSKTLDTGLAEAVFDAETGELISVRFIPALQSGCRASLLEGSEKQRVLKFMQGLSGGVRIDEEGGITEK